MKTKCAAILVAIATVYVAIAAGGKAIEPVPDFDHAPARRLCAQRVIMNIHVKDLGGEWDETLLA